MAVAAVLSFPVFLAQTHQGELEEGEERCKREDRAQK